MFLKLRLALAAAILLPTLAHARPTPAPDHWVATWATASVPMPASDIVSRDGTRSAILPNPDGTTLREIVHTSLAGPLVRLTFTNAFGTEPLTLGEVHIALLEPAAAHTGDIQLFTANALTFAGASSITIPPGGEATSDPAALTLPAGADLVISLFLPAQTLTLATVHRDAFTTSFLAPGNLVSQESLAPAVVQTEVKKALEPSAEAEAQSPRPPQVRPVTSWFFLKSVDVQVPSVDSAIVAFGDSITDGVGSTLDRHNTWPALLAARLNPPPPANPTDEQKAELKRQAARELEHPTPQSAVVNAGISGNRVLLEGNGPAALTRFDRDALTLAGAKYVILMEGINDIGVAFDPRSPAAVPMTAEQLEQGLTQLATRAHTAGLRVIGATLTPYLGAPYSSPAGEQLRETVNQWIRTTPVFDGFVDFDHATEDPANPHHLAPADDCGDHLHPSVAGYKAMADSINLALFVPAPKQKK